MDLVHDLLTTAATDVGWQIDLDQLPVTCAQVPSLVLTLIEASAAHLAGLASARILDDAAASLRAVMTGSDTSLDWEARLLATVLDTADARQRHTEQTRRRLVAALQELVSEGATWPPQPAAATDADTPVDLAGALTGLGLRPAPTTDAVGARHARTTYSAAQGEHKVTITVYPDDGDTTEVHVFDGHTLAWSWSATFNPGTPDSVIVATVHAALATTPNASPATDPS